MRLGSFEPSFFPEDQAPGLTSAMRLTIAANVLQVDSALHPPSGKPIGRIAGLVRPFIDPQTLTAMLKHLGHEWQSVQLPALIQCRQDFIFGSDFDPFLGAEVKTFFHSGDQIWRAIGSLQNICCLLPSAHLRTLS